MESNIKAKFLEPVKIRGINTVGLSTLINREVGRFLKVYAQTIIAPVISTLLFYAVFALAFGGIDRKIGDVPFLVFLAPGLVVMAMVQNAFANTSSSIIISKIQGNIVDVIMPPLSEFEVMFGYLIGALVRGFAVGLAAVLAISLFGEIRIHSVTMILAFSFLGNLFMASLGLAGGIWSEKFDHIATVTNFVITPLTFLSGTFYSVEMLPALWRNIAHYDPFFYLIDGFRYGFIGHADSNIAIGLAFLTVANLIMMALVYTMLRTGYKIKS